MKNTTRFAAVILAVLSAGVTFAFAQTTTFVPDERGFFRAWLVRGPYACEKGKTRTVDFLRELGGEARVLKLDQLGPVRFGRFPVSSPDSFHAHFSPTARVQLVDCFRPNEWVLAYAAAWFDSPEERHALLKVGSDDGVQVWLNGQKVLNQPVYRSWQRDDDVVPVALRKGRNFLLLKVDQGTGGWEFSVRFTDRAGRPLRDLREILPVRLEPSWLEEHLLDFVSVSATVFLEGGRRAIRMRLRYLPLVEGLQGRARVGVSILLGDRTVLPAVFDERFRLDQRLVRQKILRPADWKPGVYTVVTHLVLGENEIGQHRSILIW
ncbi:MAG TPA: hypothetical protein ENJ23_04050 [Bacteroidetes bacterium]|nr:hypothetical protein [Bacteroidota bacterium]